MSRNRFYVIALLAILTTGFLSIQSHQVNADCNLPGDSHGDNSPSEKKAKQMINEGASVCEIAKACDAMEIDVYIKNENQLHEASFYQNAPDDVQHELDEYMEEGSGHHGMVCYEIEEAVSE